MNLLKRFSNLHVSSFYLFYYSDVAPQWPPLMNGITFTTMLVFMEFFVIWKVIYLGIKFSFEKDLIWLEKYVIPCNAILTVTIIFFCFLYKKRYKALFISLDNKTASEYKKEKTKILLHWTFIVACCFIFYYFFSRTYWQR